jgi:glycosyl transferase, family 25
MLKTYVINLKRRNDRLQFVKEQLDQLGIVFERVNAVDGNDLSADQRELYDQKKFALECKRQLVNGEIGCALSHRAVWQQMVADKIPYALILEDDVRLKSELVSLLADSECYEAFDFLNLTLKKPIYDIDHASVKFCLDNKHLRRPALWQSRHFWRNMEKSAIVKWRIFRLHQLANGMIACECDPAPSLACCYILSLHGAISFLATSEKLFYPIDKVWHHSGGLLKQAFLLDPLAYQAFDSDINNRTRFNLSLVQKIRRYFVKGRRWRRRLDIVRLYGWKRL